MFGTVGLGNSLVSKIVPDKEPCAFTLCGNIDCSSYGYSILYRKTLSIFVIKHEPSNSCKNPRRHDV